MFHRHSAFTRRDALRLSALAGVGTALANHWALAGAASPQNSLITKAIPSTGERLPVIGLGANSFNESLAAELRNVLARFSALGATMIDSAAGYGESEAVIGKLAAELRLRDKLFIATKFTAAGGVGMGPPPGAGPGPGTGPGGPPGGPGGPPGALGGSRTGGMPGMPGMGGPQVYGKASFERSLERLKTDHIDLLYVHNMNGTDTLINDMLAWKQAKKIRYIGISTADDRQHTMMVEQMKKYPVDFVQVNYGLGGRAAEQTVLQLAAERKIAVVANVPLGGRGGRNLQAVLGKPLPAFAAEMGCNSWAQVMLKYAISHPAVTCVISGSTKTAHVDDNQQAGRGMVPDAALRKRIEQYWDSLS
jgi:aryl-alcohol dehydrogenase-like predicted oxidoreductase